MKFEPSCHMTKKLRQKYKYLENDKSFWSEICQKLSQTWESAFKLEQDTSSAFMKIQGFELSQMPFFSWLLYWRRITNVTIDDKHIFLDDFNLYFYHRKSFQAEHIIQVCKNKKYNKANIPKTQNVSKSSSAFSKSCT